MHLKNGVSKFSSIFFKSQCVWLFPFVDNATIIGGLFILFYSYQFGYGSFTDVRVDSDVRRAPDPVYP